MESEKELTIVAFGGLGGNFIERINQSRPEKTALVLVGAEDGAKTEAWD
ncbi:MAG: hypothetical protein HDQ93_00075, partial [Desulfovibrio sp.]|nr:hypothetical protein [Desulfovibrio sp.]